ncbi:MAG: DmsC/YnfH family molybdoenzyme membrane anchor subunit [Rhizomicrobium sp.]|jgi:DMSO reductase anchor subunit
MHPALSVIIFTTSSGAGYGMLFWLGVCAAANRLPAHSWFAPASLTLALVAVTIGLLSSTLHLGHPERAWRAFSQWRSSWLSREGVISVATCVPAVIFWLALLLRPDDRALTEVSGGLAALGAVLTVICTAYIYRSLKPVQRWANSWVPAGYLALAAMTGALWLSALSAFFDADSWMFETLAAVLIVPALSIKLGYWRFIDTTSSISTPESATGLGRIGRVRLLDPPNTSENYLMKEMGFRIARKHAARLRRIALIAGFVMPLLLEIATLLAGRELSIPLSASAALFATFGILIERWLFFAEAKHTVMLYYGAENA